jgi:hypothetical protein
MLWPVHILRERSVIIVVFFLAEDPETGMIIDDSFWPAGANAPLLFVKSTHWLAERRAEEICDVFRIKLLDVDGPYSDALRRIGSRKPKWLTQRPSGIEPGRWAKRLKSTEELEVYRAGMKAGRESKPR